MNHLQLIETLTIVICNTMHVHASFVEEINSVLMYSWRRMYKHHNNLFAAVQAVRLIYL